jgi:hypothetical protein
VVASCSSADKSGQGYWWAEELAMAFSGYGWVSVLLNMESLRCEWARDDLSARLVSETCSAVGRRLSLRVDVLLL